MESADVPGLFLSEHPRIDRAGGHRPYPERDDHCGSSGRALDDRCAAGHGVSRDESIAKGRDRGSAARDGRPGEADAAVAHRRDRDAPCGGVCQHRQPAPRAGTRAQPRARHPRGRWCIQRPPGPPVVDRKSRAVRRRRRDRRRARAAARARAHHDLPGHAATRGRRPARRARARDRDGMHVDGGVGGRSSADAAPHGYAARRGPSRATAAAA